MTSKEKQRIYIKQWVEANLEHVRAYKREWQKKWRLEHPAAQIIQSRKYEQKRKEKYGKQYYKMLSEQAKKWRLENPEKIMAHRKVFIAKRNGSLLQQSCQICGKEKTEAHHRDYYKPLEVEWLCKFHHVIADKQKKI